MNLPSFGFPEIRIRKQMNSAKNIWNRFSDTGFMVAIRGILLFFYLIYVFIRIGLTALWYRIFNKQKYYELMREIDRL